MLLAEMAQLDEPESLWHLSIGDLYREKVENLAVALESGDAIDRARGRRPRYGGSSNES